LALSVSRQHEIPLVMTSADPFTSHAIGLWLQRRGLRWVADLRDPHTHVHYQSARSPVVHAVQREIERAAAQRADAITVAAQSIALILNESYGVADTARFRFIPTGLDVELLPSAAPEPVASPYLIFVGEYLPDYGDAFFRYFAEAMTDPRLRARDYRLRVVGRREVNEPRIFPHLERLGLTDRVDFIDHVPQQSLYPMIQAAEFAVLCFGEHARWWCLPAKLVDYQALRKPVLAVVPNPSEARARLGETRLGIFLDGEAGARTLAEALLAGGSRYPGDDRACERYTVRSQVAAFVEVFEELLA
jgi:glycosyltransferase involved in cell wall biosynthesis